MFSQRTADVSLMILDLLDHRDLGNIRLTCKYIRELCEKIYQQRLRKFTNKFTNKFADNISFCEIFSEFKDINENIVKTRVDRDTIISLNVTTVLSMAIMNNTDKSDNYSDILLDDFEDIKLRFLKDIIKTNKLQIFQWFIHNDIDEIVNRETKNIFLLDWIIKIDRLEFLKYVLKDSLILPEIRYFMVTLMGIHNRTSMLRWLRDEVYTLPGELTAGLMKSDYMKFTSEVRDLLINM